MVNAPIRNYRVGQAMNLKKHIGLKVKRFRRHQGWTQEQLAEKVSKAVETISNVERGHAYTGLKTLEGISQALSVPMREFFEEVEAARALPQHRLMLEQSLREITTTMTDRELVVTLDLMQSLQKNRS